jgi:hypothetical protein
MLRRVTISIPPPPPSRHRSGIWIIVGLIAVVVLIALIGGALDMLSRSSNQALASQTPSSHARSSPSPTTKPRFKAHVTRTFDSHRPAVGRQFALSVPGQEKSFGCVLHSFTALGGKPRGAYLTGCPFLVSEGYEVLLIAAVLRNATSAPITYKLGNFVMTSKSGGTYGAVSIRSVRGVAAANYIPEGGKLPAGGRVQGYVTFDARTGGKPQVPSRVSYLDGRQELTILFRGKHSTD